MGYKVDNAIIMAAGLSSRFAPLSYEKPKALITVKGEVLIERQIKQLHAMGIQEIIIVVGYKKEQFYYLEEKYGVKIVENKEYDTRNNNSSIYAAKDYISNTYICSADNYFTVNPFEREVEDSYYAAVYSEGYTDEWCMQVDENNWITDVQVGGKDQWFMLGHAFWSSDFSEKFLNILKDEYDSEETKGKFWENIYIEHIYELKMQMRKYSSDFIYEFDSLDELREFDETYKVDSKSIILKSIAEKLGCKECEIKKIVPEKDSKGAVIGIRFEQNNDIFQYNYEDEKIKKMIKSQDVNRIKELMKNIFGEESISDIQRMGGLTNRTYLITLENKKYVVRIPGEGTEELIDRKNEKISTELACSIGIDTKLYFFDSQTGEKVTKFIEHSQTMHPETMREEKNIVLVAKTLKELHTSGVDTRVSFDVIDMAESYEKFILANGGYMYDDYDDVKAYINQVKSKYLPNVIKTPCHNDPLCENWILQNSENMYLIDWEYAGMNDPMWDVADVSIEAEFDYDMDKFLLDSYLGREANEKEWNAFLINKVLIDYLWSLWGKTRAVYDGEEMEQYALDRWARMKNNIRLMEG